MMADLVCLGEPLVEFNRRADGLWLEGHGGDVSNTAIAAARMGARTAILTRLGADIFGDSLMALWAREGVDASAVIGDAEAATGLYFVTHGPDGHHFAYARAGSAASRLVPTDLKPEMFNGVRILHVSGISLAISESARQTVFAAIAMAKKAGARISFDTNLRLRLWGLDQARQVIGEAAAMADIVLPGLDDAVQLTGLIDPDAIASHYLGLGAAIVALTLGKEGVLIATGDRREMIAGHVVAAVDATGAGDAFDGAFLACLLEGMTPFEAGRLANAAAALSTLGAGAVAPLPRRAEVEAVFG
ncbi:MAG: sugar kinase [Rhizobiaceae bacterium]